MLWIVVELGMHNSQVFTIEAACTMRTAEFTLKCAKGNGNGEDELESQASTAKALSSAEKTRHRKKVAKA